MMPASPDHTAFSLLSRTLTALGKMLDWSVVNKVRLLGAFSILAVAAHHVVRRFFFSLAEVAPHINWAVERQVRVLETIMLIGWAGMSTVGALVRRDSRWEGHYEHLGVQFFTVSWVAAGYFFGVVSFEAGVFVAGAPMIGFIVFRTVTVLAGLTSAAALLTGIGYATVSGLVPYAPILQVPPFEDGRVHTWWLLLEAGLAAPFLLTSMMCTGLMLARWRERERGIVELAIKDPLTGVFNRRHFFSRLEEERASGGERGTAVSVVLLDLDHFKGINDGHGHVVGDQALIATANKLKETVRTTDVVGRYGGEEFIIMLPRASNEGPHVVAERCRRAIASLHLTTAAGDELRITASFGVGTCTPDEPIEAFLKRVDAALYMSKEGGRNRVTVARHPNETGAQVALEDRRSSRY